MALDVGIRFCKADSYRISSLKNMPQIKDENNNNSASNKNNKLFFKNNSPKISRAFFKAQVMKLSSLVLIDLADK